MSKVVELIEPDPSHEQEFLELVAVSAELHRGWVQPPVDHEGFERYLERISSPLQAGFLASDVETGGIVGVVNINDIRLGSMRGGSLGYYGFATRCGGGRMTDAVRQATDIAFGELGLHRLEANIQPQNAPSLALVERLGFRLEGFSPRFLYICGDWRDHERWAVLSEDW
jgi:[ribosomal protein S5]-alanine N-acetyltransferase